MPSSFDDLFDKTYQGQSQGGAPAQASQPAPAPTQAQPQPQSPAPKSNALDPMAMLEEVRGSRATNKTPQSDHIDLLPRDENGELAWTGTPVNTSALGLAGEAAKGLVTSPFKAIKGIYDSASQFQQDHPVLAAAPGAAVVYPILQGIGNGIKDNWKKANVDQDQHHYGDALVHSIASLPGAAQIGSMYDKYQNHDLSGLANDFGDTAFQMLFAHDPEAVTGAAKDLASDAAAGTAKHATNGAVAAGKGLLKTYGDMGDIVQRKILKPVQDGEMFSPSDPAAAADLGTKALRGSVPAGRQNFVQNFQERAMPLIKQAADANGIELTGVDSELEAIKRAKALNRSQMKQAMGPLTDMGAEVHGKGIANAIRDTITPQMKTEAAINPRTGKPFVSESAAQIDKINGMADAYDKPFTLDELEGHIRGFNNKLDTFYSKNPAARSAAMANPETASLSNAAKAARNTLYDYTDKASSDLRQPSPVRDLQKDYGALSEREEALQKRKNVAIRQAPSNLADQLSTIEAAGHIAGGAATALMGGPLAGMAEIARGIGTTEAAKWIKSLQQSDGLIERAYKNYKGKPKPFVPPAPFQAKALLNEPPIQMPGVADPSGPIPQPPPQRLIGARPPSVKQLGPATNKFTRSDIGIGSSGGDFTDLVPVVTPSGKEWMHRIGLQK